MLLVSALFLIAMFEIGVLGMAPIPTLAGLLLGAAIGTLIWKSLHG